MKLVTFAARQSSRPVLRAGVLRAERVIDIDLAAVARAGRRSRGVKSPVRART